MLLCLLLVILPNVTAVLPDYDTAEDLREKARHIKREEQAAHKWAKHARKKRDYYDAEAAHKRDAPRHKECNGVSEYRGGEVIFRLKNDLYRLTNEVSWPIASICQVRAC